MQINNPTYFYLRVNKELYEYEASLTFPTIFGLVNRTYYTNPHDPQLCENFTPNDVILKIPAENFPSGTHFEQTKDTWKTSACFYKEKVIIESR